MQHVDRSLNWFILEDLSDLQPTKSNKPIKEEIFTHLLYFSGPVKPSASIIFVKAPTFSSDG